MNKTQFLLHDKSELSIAFKQKTHIFIASTKCNFYCKFRNTQFLLRFQSAISIANFVKLNFLLQTDKSKTGPGTVPNMGVISHKSTSDGDVRIKLKTQNSTASNPVT